jgi:hypothetical protein
VGFPIVQLLWSIEDESMSPIAFAGSDQVISKLIGAGGSNQLVAIIDFYFQG